MSAALRRAGLRVTATRLAAYDVDGATGQTPCLSPSRTHGFVLDETEVVFRGTCPGCRAAGAGPFAPARTSGTPTHHHVEESA